MQAAKQDVERLVRTPRNHIANGAYEEYSLAQLRQRDAETFASIFDFDD